MAYVKNNWKDQIVERPKTYEITNNSDGSVTLIDSFGLVTELGTPVNADNMNHIEDGVAACDLVKYSATETYLEKEWVTGIIENEKSIYVSLVDNNIGNPLTDTTKWQKVNLGGGGGTGSAGLNLFDTVLKDHILTFEESKGLALQGTYVYKDAVAGSRYGYPDFYNECVKQMNEGTAVNIFSPITLPTFTSNTTEGITVSDTFLGDNAYTLMNGTNNAAVGSWNGYTFNINYGTLTKIYSYNLTADNLANPEYPSAWTFQASNDGENWDILDSQEDVTFSLGQTKTFDVSTENLYSQYRLVFSNGAESSGSGELSQISFKADKKECTIYKNSNGHAFYDIADKAAIDEIYNNTGTAWYYGVDTANERIFLPRNDNFVQCTGNTADVGKFIEAGLPNITGSVISTGVGTAFQTTEGALKSPEGNGSVIGNYTGSYPRTAKTLTLDASNSNSIYGNSDTVQPAAVKKLVYMVVGSTEVTSSITDVTEITTSENDTIPLFTAQYFEFTPNNASWLKAGQQKNSGGIYTTAYNTLVNCLTDNIYNLKVVDTADMTAGVDYSEYWKVDQTNMTFTTPIKISYLPISADSAPVSGTGMSLGMTDGTTNFSFIIGDNINGVTYAKPNNYYTPNGTLMTGPNLANNKTVGVTTDPEKSGLVADLSNAKSSTAQLYFKVANAVENLEMLDAGEVLEALSDKIGRQDCKAYITETYINGTSWYRVYSDGWCEQGGRTIAGQSNIEVTFLRRFKNTSYSAQASVFTNANNVAKPGSVGIMTTTGMTVICDNYLYPMIWTAQGYLEVGEY